MSPKLLIGLLAVPLTLCGLSHAPVRAAVLTDIRLIDVPGAASGTTTAFNINNSGTIAGTYEDPAIGFRVFTLKNGIFATVDPAGSVNGSSLVSLNNAGQVVGFSNTATPPNFGSYYLASNGTFTAFPPPGITVPANASYSFYNDVGAIGGQTATGGFIAQGGTVTPITPPDGGNVVVNTINNSNQAVGGYFPATPPSPTANQEAYLFANGVFTPLYVPGSAFTAATGISDNGVVVGYYDLAQMTGPGGIPFTPIVGFTYSKGVYTSYSVPGAAETELFAINNAGQVVGYEGDEMGNAHGFVADLPEPATVMLVGAGLLGLAGLRFSRRMRPRGELLGLE